jgi:hypothetical protein
LTTWTSLGGLLLAVLLAVQSQTAVSTTFVLVMAVAAGVCFLIDLLHPYVGTLGRRPPA